MLTRNLVAFLALSVVLSNSTLAGGGFGSVLGGMGAAGQGMQEAADAENYRRESQQRQEYNANLIRQQRIALQQQQMRRLMVESVNQNSPKMVDQNTRLDGAMYVNDAFVYKYTMINLEASQIDATSKNRLYLQLKSSTCSNESLRTILATGEGVGYSYRDRYGVNAMYFVIRSADCV